MKKIIGGKIYNTETAEQIDRWSNGASCTDFNHCTETLFRSKKGAWFLYGEGGAMSRYAISLEGGKSFGGGKDIVPMSNAEAREWLEQHECTDAIETHFADELQEA